MKKSEDLKLHPLSTPPKALSPQAPPKKKKDVGVGTQTYMTKIRDLDNLILSFTDDRALFKFLLVNKNLAKLANEGFRKRLIQKYPYLVNKKPENKTWSFYYIEIVNYVSLLESLDITYTEHGGAYVKLNENYTYFFGETPFYKEWIQQTKHRSILTVILQNYGGEWNLDEIYFSPHLIKLKNGQTLYSLLNSKERKFFQGLGTAVLNKQLKYLISLSSANESSGLTLGASDLMVKNGDITKLVKFYETISFKVDYNFYEQELGRIVTPESLPYEIKNIGVEGFLGYVPMISTFGEIIRATDTVISYLLK